MNRCMHNLGARFAAWRQALGLAVVFLVALSPGRAVWGAEAGELALATERVVVFKDGYALVVKRATGVVNEEGLVYTEQVPDAAVLGTFWATAAEGRVRGMLAEWVEDREPITASCERLPELLLANVGKKLTLELGDGRTIEGTLEEALADDWATGGGERDDGPWVDVWDYRSRWVRAPAWTVESSRNHGTADGGAKPEAALLVMQLTSGSRMALAASAVAAIRGEELATTLVHTPAEPPRKKRLSFDLGEAAAGKAVELSLMYFRPGIRWIPTYRLTSDMVDSGVLALQGEILNEAEDIEGAAFDLVVGVPNFRFRDTVSPLVLERAMRRALREAAPTIMGQQVMSNSFASRATEWRQPSAGDDASLCIAPELTGSDADDLFVYHLGDFSIDKGARATAFLWQDEVGFEHLYTLDLEINRMGQPQAREIDPLDQSDSPLDLLATRVWHQLKIRNDSDVPWTTGAVLLLQDWLPLAQELLTYTSIGGEAMVPVTVAVDVRAEQEERETERAKEPITWRRHHYYRVDKAGSVTIRSFRQEESRVRVSVTVHGPVLSASDGGEFRNQQSPGHREYRADAPALNPDGLIVWEFDLEAGASKTLEYTYYYYDG
ncbi:MAG: hypothetical protein ACF8NJ_11035 [Phycisphaerales bacterium JB038]